MSRKITEKVLGIDELSKFVNGGKWIEVTPRPFFFWIVRSFKLVKFRFISDFYKKINKKINKKEEED
jgi:hypothetical protein